jgi:flagellar motor switch protein FliM
LGAYIDINPTILSVETNARVIKVLLSDEIIIQVLMEVEIKM